MCPPLFGRNGFFFLGHKPPIKKTLLLGGPTHTKKTLLLWPPSPSNKIDVFPGALGPHWVFTLAARRPGGGGGGHLGWLVLLEIGPHPPPAAAPFPLVGLIVDERASRG